jgi:hypothetical protein
MPRGTGKCHSPPQIVEKLRDSDAMMNAGKTVVRMVTRKKTLCEFDVFAVGWICDYLFPRLTLRPDTFASTGMRGFTFRPHQTRLRRKLE